ncbi:MAG: cytochrome c maturation protein CcmE, partial [Gammaproteobacteria bacterium]|nr:cytochrome c maturation protein CcmE [Gammaproteobacteria bacterium]
MKTRHKRLAIIVTGVLGLTVAVLLVLDAFQSNLVFFYSPTEVLEGKVK